MFHSWFFAIFLYLLFFLKLPNQLTSKSLIYHLHSGYNNLVPLRLRWKQIILKRKKSKYSVRIQESADQKNPEYDHFSHSEGDNTEKWVECYRYNQPKYVAGIYYKNQVIIFSQSQ